VFFRAALLLGVLTTTSCIAQEPTPVITLRRTACFGTCPVYSLEIFEDGFIRYVGIDFVQYRGEHRAVIPRDAVGNLIALFLRADYFALKDNYETYRDPNGTVLHLTDLPTVYTSLRIGTRKKSVRNYAFAPKRLTDLEEEIDKAANTRRWIGNPLLNIPAPLP
jgi:hypothetical protein